MSGYVFLAMVAWTWCFYVGYVLAWACYGDNDIAAYTVQIVMRPA